MIYADTPQWRSVADVSVTDENLSSGEPVLATLLVAPRGIIRGRVFDSTGTPIDGAIVSVMKDSSGLANAFAMNEHGMTLVDDSRAYCSVTDKDGVFSVDGGVGVNAQADMRCLIVQARGYLDRLVSRSTSSNIVEVQLERAAEVSGRLVDKYGTAIPLASVEVVSRELGSSGARGGISKTLTTIDSHIRNQVGSAAFVSSLEWLALTNYDPVLTDSGGRFAVSAMLSNDVQLLRASKYGYRPVSTSLVAGSEKVALGDIQLEADPALSVFSGVVRNSDGNVCDTALILIVGEEGFRRVSQPNAQGAFVFSLEREGIGGGSIQAIDMDRSLTSEVVPLDVSGEKGIILELSGTVSAMWAQTVVGPTRCIIRGTVRDAATGDRIKYGTAVMRQSDGGSSIGMAPVNVSETIEEGKFVMVGSRRPATVLGLYAAGYIGSVLAVDTSRSIVEVAASLEPAYPCRFKVQDSRGGGVGGAVISLSWPDGYELKAGEYGERGFLVSDADGWTDTVALRSGPCQARIRCNKSGIGGRRPVDIVDVEIETIASCQQITLSVSSITGETR
jgi:hypothetical protein